MDNVLISPRQAVTDDLAGEDFAVLVRDQIGWWEAGSGLLELIEPGLG